MPAWRLRAQASSPLKPLEKGIGGRIGMFDHIDVHTKEVCIAQYGFYLFQALAHFAEAVTVEAELVQRFEHAGLHEIALEADVVVMADVVGLFHEHLQQEAFAAQRRGFLEVYLRIGHGCFDDVFFAGVGLVLCVGEVVRAPEDDNGFAGIDKFGDHGFERGVGICEAAAGEDVAGVCEANVFMPVVELVELAADSVRRGVAIVGRAVAAFFARAKKDNIGAVKVRRMAFLVAVSSGCRSGGRHTFHLHSIGLWTPEQGNPASVKSLSSQRILFARKPTTKILEFMQGCTVHIK